MKNEMKKIIEKFRAEFGGSAAIGVRAPGRVNLIGEHTDYNDGFVLPMALEQAVYAAGRASGSGRVRLYSMNFDARAEFDMSAAFVKGALTGWGLYAEGVARVLCERAGAGLEGFDAVVWGDVPLGSGLSSSAAFEVAAGYFLCLVNGLELSPAALAGACQEAENRYAGVQCGIMDQYISCAGKKGHAALIDCRTLGCEYVPLPEDTHEFMVLNTGVARGLAGSAYNDRRRSCESGVAAIRAAGLDAVALRDVSVSDFVELEAVMDEDTERKCRHVVTENARVAAGAVMLRKGDTAGFGRLMDESHESLRDDYEVSCRELDVLHEAAREIDGVAGERMTGAGFGGCAVALVDRKNADDAARKFEEVYKRETGRELLIYRSSAGDGVGRVEF